MRRRATGGPTAPAAAQAPTRRDFAGHKRSAQAPTRRDFAGHKRRLGAQAPTRRDFAGHKRRLGGGRRRVVGRGVVAAVLGLAALAAVTGCSDGSAASAGRHTTLTVLAASSLTESFDALATTFEKQHPGVDVRLTYDSSATLAQQAVQGAPGDVLATADTRTMRTAVDGKAIAGTPRRFATNRMVLVVPRANPAHLRGVTGVSAPGVTFVMCDPSAPCGALGRQVLALAGVHARPASLEPDVKSVLTKVALDEADAGLVYATDAASARAKVRSFPIPNTSEAVNTYLIAPVASAGEPDLARAWVRLVTSRHGQDVLRAHGFGRP